MNCFVVLGWKSLNAEPECLYVGKDGIKAQQAGVDARNSGQFARLGKLVNPAMVPLPPIPDTKPAAMVSSEMLNSSSKKKSVK